MREMKDSGIEWIGEIPKDWKRTSLLNLLRCKISDGPHETPSLIDEGIPFISVDSLGENQNIDFSKVKRFISEEDYIEYNKKANLEKGDILFSKAATIGKTAIVRDEKFMVWSPLAIIKADEKICNNKYIYYLLNCEQLIKYVSLLGGYNTQINVGMRTLEKAFVPFPNIEEQNKIANFLDDKYVKIDRMLAKEQDEIEKLKEYKQSIITETVTKGIRKNISVKKINTEWIHEIPSSWKISKLKYIFKFGKGLPITKEDLKEEGVPVISYGQVHSKENTGISISNDLIRYVDTEFKDNYPNCIVKKGEFIFADTSEDLDGCGNAVYNNQNDLLLAGYHSIIFKSKFSDNRYFAYLFQTDCWRSQIRCRTTGIKLFSITQKILKEVSICIPPKEEQREIANYLDTKCKKIELMIKEKNKKIDKLKMYQKSLIYECVTGKKEVF